MGGDRTGEGIMGKRKCKRVGEVGKEWVGTGQGKVWTEEGIMGKREWKG